MSQKSLAPSNATAFERDNAEVSGSRMHAIPVAIILKERDPLACDPAFVAPLAWERSVHFWNPGDDGGNRARSASSFADHLNYGCPAALEDEIALDTGQRIAVREFFEISGLTWPDFIVDSLFDPGEAQPDLAAVRCSALNRKPVRDVLARVRAFASQPGAVVVVAAACCMSPRVVILPLGEPAAPPQIYVGASVHVALVVTILPLGGG